MSTCTLFLLVVAVAVASFAGVCRCHHAQLASTSLPPTTIEATCQAAHDADRLVSPILCMTRLPRQRGAAGADVWGLAKVAAVMGVGNADAARYEVESTLHLRRRDDDPKSSGQAALERCRRLYGSTRASFAAAHEALVERRCGDARKSLAGVPALGHQCGVALLSDFAVDNQQIAYLTIAITNLIP